jgi:hypothetical protein
MKTSLTMALAAAAMMLGGGIASAHDKTVKPHHPHHAVHATHHKHVASKFSKKHLSLKHTHKHVASKKTNKHLASKHAHKHLASKKIAKKAG